MRANRVLKAAFAASAAAAAFLAVSPASASVKPCTTATVAFVKDVAGKDGSIRIKRGNTEGPLTVFSPLCQGDMLNLKSAGDRVVMAIAGASAPREIKGPATYTVGGAETGDQSISEVIESRLLPLGDRMVAQGLGRSAGEFTFGLLDLEAETARIHTGFRPLWVGWVGGQAPFELIVLDPSDRLITSTTLSDTSTTLNARDITPGRYSILVRDSFGRTRQTFFEAVEETPPAPAVEAPGWMGPDTRAMFAAFCIAAEDPFTWSYEAAQHLNSVPDNGLDREAALALLSSGDTAALCPSN